MRISLKFLTIRMYSTEPLNNPSKESWFAGFSLILPDNYERLQQVSAQHYHHLLKWHVLLRANHDRWVGIVLLVQLKDLVVPITWVLEFLLHIMLREIFSLIFLASKLSCFSQREESVGAKVASRNQLFRWGCKCRHRRPHQQCWRNNDVVFQAFLPHPPSGQAISQIYLAQLWSISWLTSITRPRPPNWMLVPRPRTMPWLPQRLTLSLTRFRFITMDQTKSRRNWDALLMKTPSRGRTSRSHSYPSWLNRRRERESFSSFRESADSKKNRRSLTFRKFTPRTCADSTVGWRSSSRCASVCPSSTNEKVHGRLAVCCGNKLEVWGHNVISLNVL